jgi:predicted ATP-grasp superfamily ATP-dependent carboligase
VEKVPYKIIRTSRIKKPALIICWKSTDVGGLASGAVDFLIEKLGGREIAKVDPTEFFALSGVKIAHDIATMHECTFYACEDSNLLLLKTDEPEEDRFAFLNVLLDVAESFQTEEFYTVNGNPALISHAQTRQMLSVCNDPHFGETLEQYGLSKLYYEGPPSLSGFLLWTAQRRTIKGASIWIDIPFYLTQLQDFQALYLALDFFNRKYSLHLSLNELNATIQNQNVKIEKFLEEVPEIRKNIHLLESGIMLDNKEQMNIVQQFYDFFKKKGR